MCLNLFRPSRMFVSLPSVSDWTPIPTLFVFLLWRRLSVFFAVFPSGFSSRPYLSDSRRPHIRTRPVSVRSVSTDNTFLKLYSNVTRRFKRFVFKIMLLFSFFPSISAHLRKNTFVFAPKYIAVGARPSRYECHRLVNVDLFKIVANPKTKFLRSQIVWIL